MKSVKFYFPKFVIIQMSVMGKGRNYLLTNEKNCSLQYDNNANSLKKSYQKQTCTVQDAA